MSSIPKKKTSRDKKYLAWIRQQPCLVSGSEYDIVAHPVRLPGEGGIGMKVSDYYTVPLRAEIHVQLHLTGEMEFWSLQYIKPTEELVRLLESYPYQNDNLRDDLERLYAKEQER
jgi:hypothetical protein